MIALMVGGPLDGQVHEVTPTDKIDAWEPTRPSIRAEEWAKTPRTVQYRRTEMEILGLKIPVFILDDWPAERIEATLVTNLLSDLARRLAEQ